MNVVLDERWTAWLMHFRDVRAVASTTVKAYDGLRHSRQQHAFMMLLNRATENAGAIICLFEAGWENDATALMRALTDIYIDMRFIRTDPGPQASRFLDYSIVTNRWKKDLIHRVYGTPVDEQIRRDYAHARAANALRDDIRTVEEYVVAYHSEVQRAQSLWDFRRSGWSNLNAASKARHVDRHVASGTNETELVYDLIYRSASEALHSGIGSVLRTMTIDGPAATLDHDPRPPRPTALLVLIYSAFMLSKVLDYANAELALGVEPELLRLERDFVALVGPTNPRPSDGTDSGQAVPSAK